MMSSDRKCAVCEDTPAKVHYGVLACFGCKGFFRRAVKDGRNKYVCRFENNCQVNKIERNSCRYCRFRRCLLVGMNPDAVRPDRESTKQKLHRQLSKRKSLGRSNSNRIVEQNGDFTTLLPTTHRRLLNDLISLESQLQKWSEHDHHGVVDFNLRSLIADRSLARMTKSSMDPSSLRPSPSSPTELLSIDRIVSSIDFIDGFLSSTGEDAKKITVEDKCALISDSFLALSLMDSTARLVAQGSNNFIEDFSRHLNRKEVGFPFSLRFSHLCETFKSRTPSPMEFSILRAYLICCADPSLLSNLLGASLSSLRESLHELLFRVLKLSRGIPSATAASTMASLVTFAHNTKMVSSLLRDSLAPLYPLDISSSNQQPPFHRIISDLLHPQASDLVAQMSHLPRPPLHSSSNIDINDESGMSMQFSPPILTENHEGSGNFQQNLVNCAPLAAPPPQCRQPISIHHFVPPPPPSSSSTSSSSDHPFLAPSPIRPKFLDFSAKIPLTITKSIEDMLRAPGVGEELLNRPLATDWADGFRLTPVFNRDVVAQFFPELTGTQM